MSHTILIAAFVAFSLMMCLYCYRLIDKSGRKKFALFGLVASIVCFLSIGFFVLGGAKPIDWELREIKKAEVVKYHTDGKTIWVWLWIEGEPVSYSMAYSHKTDSTYRRAMRDAGDFGVIKMDLRRRDSETREVYMNGVPSPDMPKKDDPRN